MVRNGAIGHEAWEVANVGSCIVSRIAVEYFVVEARFWNSHSVFAYHWSEVAADDEEVVWILGFADVPQHAILRVHAVDPFKAVRREIQFMQRWFSLNEMIEVRNELLHAAMRVPIQ